ncbi:hypothetical protein [Salinisphaera shabanensis]|nr:hypothetical protein [Salinisphaera shabanensis]
MYSAIAPHEDMLDFDPALDETHHYDEVPGTAWAQQAAAHSVGDYVDDSGRIRIWGNVAQLLTLDYEAPSAKRRWPHPVHGSASRNTTARRNPAQHETTP